MRMEEQLRLDAIDARRVGEQFDEVLEEAKLNFGRGMRTAAAGHREGVADNRFVFLINSEYVAGGAAVLDGDVAGKNARVEILEEQISGGAIIPSQALVPKADLLIEHRTQRVRREVAKVEDLELDCRRHASLKCRLTSGLFGLRGYRIDD